MDEAGELARVVASSLGASHPGRVAVLRALVAHAVSASQMEASVRVSRGGRMMIERASAALVEPLARALGVSLGDDARRLLAAAARAGVPLIAGWDVARSEAAFKLYANASDASREVRAAIARDTGWGALAGLPAPPHLVAINVSRGGSERKAYEQHGTAPEEVSVGARGEGPRELAARAAAHGVAAGYVVSYDVGEAAVTPRAFFVALRDGDSGDAGRGFLASLPGCDDVAIARALPFERGQCRSVGVAIGAELSPWTAYFKPRRRSTALWSVEPAAVFRAGEVEVGVFFAPREFEPRAYARTARHALSYRVRQGTPDRAAVESLMRWAASLVRASERAGVVIALDREPPAPWQRVRA